MELNEQTQKAFGVISKEEAEEMNKERSLFDKIFKPVDSRVVSDDVKKLFLDPEVNLTDLFAKKRPEDISAFDTVFKTSAYYGESKADIRDLLALKKDKDFMEEFANAQNERAALKRKESENSIRNTGYDFLTERLNLDPSTAQGVVTAAEFVPFVGDAPMIEDAIDQFRKGDIKEGALTTLLATAGIAFDGIPLIVNSIKKTKTGIPKKEVTPEEDALSSPLIPKMFVGEKSKFADKVASKEMMESRQLTAAPEEDFGVSAVAEFPAEIKNKVYNQELFISNFGPNKGKLVQNVPDTESNPYGEIVIPLRTSAERLQDSKNTFRKFYRDNRIMHSGDIITDLKKMPEEQRLKTQEMLREIWLKNGWTVGKNNKFYTEVSDANLILGDPNDSFKFKLFLNEQKQDLVNGGLTLPRPLKDVFAHPKLYEAYPQLKNLAIRVMTRDDHIDYDDVGGYYSYNGRDGVSEIVMKINGFEGKDFNVKRVKELSESGQFTEGFIETLLHEIQHAIQHIEGLNYNANKVFSKDKAFKAKEFLKKVLPRHIEDFEKADAKLKSLNPKDYDPKDNFSPYKMAERERESMRRVLQERGYKLDELNNLDLEDKYGSVNYYDTMREIESRLSENRLYYDMDARAEILPFDEMTTRNEGISGLDILRKASSDKNGRVDFKKYHKLRAKVLEPIFKQKEEGEKILDKAFEDLTGMKFDIRVPNNYEDLTNMSKETSAFKNNQRNMDILDKLFYENKITPSQRQEAINILNIKLENLHSKIKGDKKSEVSPYVLIKFSTEGTKPDSGYLIKMKDPSDFGYNEKYIFTHFDRYKDVDVKKDLLPDELKPRMISVPFEAESKTFREYFFVREKDLVYNTLHRKRSPTEYMTVKGEVRALSFDEQQELKTVYQELEFDPLLDEEERLVERGLGKIKPITKDSKNTDDNTTLNLFDATVGSNNNFSTNPLLRTLLKRQSTSGPSGVNKFNQLNLTTKKLKPRLRGRVEQTVSTKDAAETKFFKKYHDTYNTELIRWRSDMLRRKEPIRLEEIKDYDFERVDPQMGISDYNEGQATLEEIFPQMKSPYDAFRLIKDPVYLPDNYDYYQPSKSNFRIRGR